MSVRIGQVTIFELPSQRLC